MSLKLRLQNARKQLQTDFMAAIMMSTLYWYST